VIDPAEGRGLGRRTMPQTLEQSVAMAIFAMWLAARAQNLGLGMVSILDPDRVAQVLDAPADWRFAAWLCVGYPAADDDMPLLHRVRWQENVEREWLTR
jgi:5,6-dimethylbenzimidazole synthase